MSAVQNAEFAIASVLAELERSTGQHVQGISVESIEVTKLIDERPRWMRNVVIDLRPTPGSTWRTS